MDREAPNNLQNLKGMSSPRSTMKASLILLGIALGGCLSGHSVVSALIQPAPVWAPEMAWAYRITGASGEGWSNWTVVGNETHARWEVYNLTEVESRGTSVTRRTHYVERSTLHEVGDFCTRSPPRNPCAVELRHLSFPLHHGKTWTTVEDASDVPIPLAARAELQSREQGLWRITLQRSCDACGASTTTLTYDSERGLVRERTVAGADGVQERWTLQ